MQHIQAVPDSDMHAVLADPFKRHALTERLHMAGPVLGAGNAALQAISWSL